MRHGGANAQRVYARMRKLHSQRATMSHRNRIVVRAGASPLIFGDGYRSVDGYS